MELSYFLYDEHLLDSIGDPPRVGDSYYIRDLKYESEHYEVVRVDRCISILELKPLTTIDATIDWVKEQGGRINKFNQRKNCFTWTLERCEIALKVKDPCR